MKNKNQQSSFIQYMLSDELPEGYINSPLVDDYPDYLAAHKSMFASAFPDYYEHYTQDVDASYDKLLEPYHMRDKNAVGIGESRYATTTPTSTFRYSNTGGLINTTPTTPTSPFSQPSTGLSSLSNSSSQPARNNSKTFEMVGLTDENPYSNLLHELGIGAFSQNSKYYDDVMKTIKTNNGIQPEFGKRDIDNEGLSTNKIGYKMADVLTVDSWTSPFGQRYNANLDLAKNYFAMKLDKTKRADDYFHCKANYEATQRGPYGELVANIKGLEKEKKDYYKNIKVRGLTPKEALIDYYHDNEINRIGRELAKTRRYKNAEEACNMFRVSGINSKF